jgi:hypothetical protein
MKLKKLKELIATKKGVVNYKNKDKRKSFDETWFQLPPIKINKMKDT